VIGKGLAVALVAGALVACAGALRPQEPMSIAPDVRVRQLAPGVWLHTSHKDLPGIGPVPSNGLVIQGSGGALLVDTAWSRAQTRQLLEWIRRELKAEVREVIVTHSHEDRLGGIEETLATAKVHALPATVELASKAGISFPAVALDPETRLELAGVSVEVLFPGAGHAPDNIVVWHPASGVLFGGCFVKSGGAKDLGNVADANIASWQTAIQRVAERFPAAKIVVPGHGEPGGLELLGHTRDLVDAALKKPGSGQ
jgi:metallo-beta-lactamase class B